jgi:uncharacterized protein (DUF427 family)
MTLTVGRGPFGQHPAGRFDVQIPEHVVYVESFPRRVRGVRNGETVVDSDAVKLVHASGRLPYYAFPAGDVRVEEARDEPAAPGHVRVPWDAVDAWFEEDEQVFVHVRDPYHRIDAVPTSRRVVVSLDGVVLADSGRAVGLYETSLPVRWYLPREDVRTDLLERSETITQCAYKGQPVHWSARLDGTLHEDVAWSYDDDVRREAEDVRGRIAFYDERVDVDVDGVRQERPVTPWSQPHTRS